MLEPVIITGACYQDDRGELRYNNNFDVSSVKRIYLIQNTESNPVRGWQGHKVEQRWFVAVNGVFEINVVGLENWDSSKPDLPVKKFKITQEQLDVLYVPPGFATAIRSLAPGSTLLAMSDYRIGEIVDDYRFPLSEE